MDPLLLSLLGAAIAVGIVFLAGAAGFLLWRRVTRDEAQRGEQTLMLMQQMEGLRQQTAESLSQSVGLLTQHLGQVTTQVNAQINAFSQQLSQTTGQIGVRLDTAAKVVGEVRQNLGELSKAAERIFDVGRDISSLQEILRAPKFRGTLGELFLGELLGQILPPTHFTLQHGFNTGEVVDAVIHLGPGLVPIDSKFPLENFKRLIACEAEDEKKAARKRFVTDLKRHIDHIASKYILPDEGTFDFALMYIPAENVYYETMIRDDAFGEDKSLTGYALSRRVIPVSPNSFYAYLQAIVLGLKGLRIEKGAQEMIRHLGRLQGDFTRFREDFEVVGKHLGHTKNRYDEAARRLERFGEKLDRMDPMQLGEDSQAAAKDPAATPPQRIPDLPDERAGAEEPSAVTSESPQSKLI